MCPKLESRLTVTERDCERCNVCSYIFLALLWMQAKASDEERSPFVPQTHKYTSKTRTGFMRHCGRTRGQSDMVEFSRNEGDASDTKAERLVSLKSVSVPHSTFSDFPVAAAFCCFVRRSLTQSSPALNTLCSWGWP